MKLPVIRELAAQHSLDELRAAEAAIAEEQVPAFPVPGEDEGEQLTHVLGAIHVVERTAAGMDPAAALREFAQRVRTCLN